MSKVFTKVWAQFLIIAALVGVPSWAHAISLVIHVHFETFAEGGQQPDEADLVGWRVELRNPEGGVIANLVTGANGDTAPVDVPAGNYVAALALPVPNPYDPNATWPNTPVFPFTINATNAQGQPISSFRLRIGLGCTCNDQNVCTTDLCNAGFCSTRPNYRPEVPDVCDAIDNDCDGQTDEGLPVPCSGTPPGIIGCADGTREGFMNLGSNPTIAACGGAWTNPGLDGPPTCNRAAGNHATNRPGAGCSAADLCAAGWHVCHGPGDVAARATDGCALAVDPFYANFGVPPFGEDATGTPLVPPPGGAFFATRASDATCGDVVVGGAGPGASTYSIQGCGNLGLEGACAPLDRMAGPLCGGLTDTMSTDADNPATDWGYPSADTWAWQCTAAAERATLIKRFPDRQGGVLCCKDSAAGLPEVCDGLDNDLDGTTDESPSGSRVGDSCPIGLLCGTLECDNDGTFACVDPLPCIDDTCDGIDDDQNGQTDEAYPARDVTCGVGVCFATGRLDCVDGDETDTCVIGYREEDSDLTCNGRDGDCDGQTDEDFVSNPTTCGLGSCASTGSLLCEAGVPRNTCVARPPLSSTDATCNGIDENCDGTPDDAWVQTPTACGRGVCVASGVLACIAGIPTNTCTPGTPLSSTDATCDNVDDDCDGQTDEDYVPPVTSCGSGPCLASGVLSCLRGVTTDTCEPLAPTVETDTTCDAIDDDCDGQTDDNYVGAATSCGVGACAATGAFDCQSGVVVDSCTTGTPAASDPTCDGIDDDCDAITDEDFVPYASTCGVGVCAGQGGTVTCVDGAPVDSCDPLTGAGDESCNALDDDCDGLTDEDFPDLNTMCDGPDADLCANATVTCTSDGTATECLESGEPKVELCNGLDDDCDGTTDEGLTDCPDSDGDGWPDAVDICTYVSDVDQVDTDGDGVGDACDVLLQSGGGGCSSSPAPMTLFAVLTLMALALLRRRLRV
jgi:hypothetical protein